MHKTLYSLISSGNTCSCTMKWINKDYYGDKCDLKCLDDTIPGNYCGGTDSIFANVYLVDRLDGACYKEFPGGSLSDTYNLTLLDNKDEFFYSIGTEMKITQALRRLGQSDKTI